MALLKKTNGNNWESGFPSLMEDFFETDFPSMFSRFPTIPTTWTRNIPAVNIKETDNSYNLEVASPGMKREDFKIKVDGNMLEISAERREEKKEEEENYTRREFRQSSFSRMFTLPDGVNSDNINAEYHDGVLKLTIPKLEEAKKKNHLKEIKVS